MYTNRSKEELDEMKESIDGSKFIIFLKSTGFEYKPLKTPYEVYRFLENLKSNKKVNITNLEKTISVTPEEFITMFRKELTNKLKREVSLIRLNIEQKRNYTTEIKTLINEIEGSTESNIEELRILENKLTENKNKINKLIDKKLYLLYESNEISNMEDLYELSKIK